MMIPGQKTRLLVSEKQAAANPTGPSLEASLPASAVPLTKADTTGRELLRAAADSLKISLCNDLASRQASTRFISQVPIGYARRHCILGLAEEANHSGLTVVCGDPMHLGQVQVISTLLQERCVPMLARAPDIQAAINHAYQQQSGNAQEMVNELSSPVAASDGTLDREAILNELDRVGSGEDLLDNATRAPVIKLVNLILFDAVKAGASDVHVQPYEERIMVRMRIDGVLYDSYPLPKSVQNEVVGRIKVMGRLNIAEKRLPQDGRSTVQVGDRAVDLRIASLPTSYGERLVIRLLDKRARLYELAELGMDARTLGQFAGLIRSEHGLILVTGPTGSGKSTTLYSALMRLNARERNILTLEDPIEYQLPGVSQTQVTDKKGLTFARGLRSVLRQDPDVIMVGEIRDLETATMAVQSSLTGHLVFSTLHTNDAASAVARLGDLGIEAYLVASSLVGVLAQRLVRRVCQTCAKPYRATEQDLRRLNVTAEVARGMRFGAGCAACRQTGYRRRVGTFEFLAVDDAVRKLIQGRASAGDIHQHSIDNGGRSLRDDGVAKVLAGLTTLSEIDRVTSVCEPEGESGDASVAVAEIENLDG